MNNLLDSFVPIENRIKDALEKDIINIEKFLKKKKRILYDWEFNREEIRCLRLLLKNMYEIKNQNNEEILLFSDFTFEIKADFSTIDVHDFREIIREFATETLKVLVTNKTEVNCELTSKFKSVGHRASYCRVWRKEK